MRADVVADDIAALSRSRRGCRAGGSRPQPELWTRYLALVLDGLRPDGAHELPHAPPVPPIEAPTVARRRRASSR